MNRSESSPFYLLELMLSLANIERQWNAAKEQYQSGNTADVDLQDVVRLTSEKIRLTKIIDKMHFMA